MTPLPCWLFGHKFHVAERTYTTHPQLPGKVIVDTTFTPLSHCMRCGKEAPPFNIQTAKE